MKSIRLISGVLVLFGAQMASGACDFNRMEQELQNSLGLSPAAAHAYRTAQENFLANLDASAIRLKTPIAQLDVTNLATDLENTFHLNPWRARSIARSIEAAKAAIDENAAAFLGDCDGTK